MIDQTGILFDKVTTKITPRFNADDTQERGWSYGGYYSGFDGQSQEHKELVQESYKDAIKELIKEQAKEQQKFNKLVHHASQVFFRAKSAFPFTLSPSHISIDSEKITVRTTAFLSTGELRSIPIKNVSHVYLETGPFSSTLHIIDQGIMDGATSVEITHLKTDDAKRARRIIQGLMIAHKEGVDVLKLQDADIVKKLEEIGRLQ